MAARALRRLIERRRSPRIRFPSTELASKREGRLGYDATGDIENHRRFVPSPATSQAWIPGGPW